MRTTITPQGDRRGGVLEDRDHDQILDDARAILADLSAMLKEHIDELKTLKSTELDDIVRKEIDDRTRTFSKSLSQVLDMESKVLARVGLTPALDLEAARAEIESRLDRLIASPGADGVSAGAEPGDAGSHAASLGSMGSS
ncbi:MAG: hypothetical protein AAGH68_11770 [Pseudomonadota bacterium]